MELIEDNLNTWAAMAAIACASFRFGPRLFRTVLLNSVRCPSTLPHSTAGADIPILFSMREQANIEPIERLSDAVRALRMIWFLCLNCGHRASSTRATLIELAGDARLCDLRDRLKCQRCGHMRGHVVPNDVPWPTMNRTR
jgi:hypothetical protein